MQDTASEFRTAFREPPKGWGPVPFYWWAGEPLDRERMARQLDQLCAKGVRQTIISYPHKAEGITDAGEPPVFSAPWWDFLRWFLGQCRERGMTAGFQDYTLCQPILAEIGRATPDMEGGQLSCVADTVTGPATAHLEAEPDTRVIGAWAYRIEAGRTHPRPLQAGEREIVKPEGVPLLGGVRGGLELPSGFPEQTLDLSGLVQDGVLDWTTPTGQWLVVLVFARLNAFDPLHPEAGRLAIERLYAPFERECPGEVGRTLNLFFQDELDFGARMPFWSNRLSEVFMADKGYDLRLLLPALWHDLGPLTEKIRLDYSDVVVRRIEACYFEPVYRWHEAHGSLFGHDNSGRGRIAEGRQYYGDYFRAMRWYSAPGTDDPKLQGPRAFKGLKVSSSIAHLYRRPRVWNEAFHSSGWGTTPGEVVAALNEDFAYGATVVNLHGLYYSTCGGWWEWAPPDFHFRQPYWEHSQTLNTYCTRLAWLLSQGTHRCDVAIVYPIAALEAQPESPEVRCQVAHIGNGALHAVETDDPQPEESAFGLGKYLFDRTCDFDFIGDESVVRADIADGEVRVSGEAYRVLVLPAMKAVRFATLEKLRDFVGAGGLVIAYGCLPVVSDREGRGDPQLASLLQDVFGISDGDEESFHVKPHASGGCGIFIRRGYDTVLSEVSARLVRDVVTDVEPLHVLHRQLEGGDLFYVFNPTNSPVDTLLRVRAMGRAEMWDAWTGSPTPVSDISVADGISTVRVILAARESKVVVITPGTHPQPLQGGEQEGRTHPQPLRGGDQDGSHKDAGRIPSLEGCPKGGVGILEKVIARLENPWSFTLHPTLDNRYGDFRFPAFDGLMGPEARRFRYREECDLGPAVSAGGPWHGAEFDDSAWPETTWSFGPRFEVCGPDGVWRPYSFSLRWGIERDPFLTDWLSGPHGLKGQVPDEFLDFHSETPGTEWHVRSQVVVDRDREVPFVMGGRCAYQAWLNEELVLEQLDALPPGLYTPWNIPHYECVPRSTRVRLRKGVNHLRLRLVQPEGQRTRAFVAFEPFCCRAGFPGGEPASPSPLSDPSHKLPLRGKLVLQNSQESHALKSPPPLGLRWFRDPATPRPSLPGSHRATWLRCQAPPGLQAVEVSARGPVRVWADGKELAVEGNRAVASNVFNDPVTVALRIEAPPEFRAGDVLLEPVKFICGVGRIPLGDWCDHGLATYSGIGEYRHSFTVPITDHQQPITSSRLWLDLGEVAATAEVLVNGKSAGILIAPPWRLELTGLARPGRNEVVVRVANTLANHYSVGIPTPYAFPAQTRSGLIGPVRVLSAIRHQ